MLQNRFLRLIECLARHDVRYVVVGGVAAVLQRVPVNTQDFDLVHERSKENVDHLLVVLEELQATFRDDPRNLRAARIMRSGSACGSAPLRRTNAQLLASRGRRAWLSAQRSGMISGMSVVRVYDRTMIPSAPVVDLDIERDDDDEEWERRVMDLAAARIAAARDRLEAVGIVDGSGALVSRSLPPDMASDSNTTLETG